ncbi:uncharacterized protein RCO7_00309 [Rhynchosporium graminicola]|uniref:Uncharacterized protein n=1 Tax=Rhynchosporium graminicola TaxID=2792576 RepID=A0A1E1KH13_9HELO|nr:uncharacterized protein RCO7_00309 [Rhynchosporium commune]
MDNRAKNEKFITVMAVPCLGIARIRRPVATVLGHKNRRKTTTQTKRLSNSNKDSAKSRAESKSSQRGQLQTEVKSKANARASEQFQDSSLVKGAHRSSSVKDPKDNETGPELLKGKGLKAQSTPEKRRDKFVAIREGSRTEARTPKQPMTMSKNNPASSSRRQIADITFTNVPIGLDPEFCALRCNESCPKHAELDDSKLGGAHTWCMTHSDFHCSGRFNETCRNSVLCGLTVDIFEGMKTTWHEAMDQQNNMDDKPKGAGRAKKNIWPTMRTESGFGGDSMT